MIKRHEYVRSMQAKLDGWNAEIETLSGSTCNAAPEFRSSVNRQLEILNSKLAGAWKKIEQSPDAQRAD